MEGLNEMKNASEILINKIKAILESDLTPYRIAKEVGLSNATPVHKYIDGRSDIENMSLAVAAGFEKLYEEMVKMIRVKRTEVLTDSTLKFFALPQNKEVFSEHFPEDRTRKIMMIVDEDFYKALLVHPMIIKESETDGFTEEAIKGITPYEWEHLSTLDNITEHEFYHKIRGCDTADYEVSKRLAEPYRTY